MPIFQYRMPAGIPGAVTRIEVLTSEAQVVNSTTPPTSYGVPVALDSTYQQVRPITTGDAFANIYGFLIRPYPSQATSQTAALGTSVPPTSGIVDVLKRGYMMVKLNGATAAVKNGPVYVRVATPGTGKPIGGIEAASDTTNTVLITNAYFMGPADASGNTEIAYNI